MESSLLVPSNSEVRGPAPVSRTAKWNHDRQGGGFCVLGETPRDMQKKKNRRRKKERLVCFSKGEILKQPDEQWDCSWDGKEIMIYRQITFFHGYNCVAGKPLNGYLRPLASCLLPCSEFPCIYLKGHVCFASTKVHSNNLMLRTGIEKELLK